MFCLTASYPCSPLLQPHLHSTHLQGCAVMYPEEPGGHRDRSLDEGTILIPRIQVHPQASLWPKRLPGPVGGWALSLDMCCSLHNCLRDPPSPDTFPAIDSTPLGSWRATLAPPQSGSCDERCLPNASLLAHQVRRKVLRGLMSGVDPGAIQRQDRGLS